MALAHGKCVLPSGSSQCGYVLFKELQLLIALLIPKLNFINYV
jgi:hypothetical protein